MSNKKQAISSQALVDIYESMDDERRRSLSDFADFLYAQADPVVKEIPPPEAIPRPQQETVVGAVKRLKLKYPMIESMKIFSAASQLMTDHMVKGRDVVEVIDEMEILFETAYKNLLAESATTVNESTAEKATEKQEKA